MDREAGTTTRPARAERPAAESTSDAASSDSALSLDTFSSGGASTSSLNETVRRTSLAALAATTVASRKAVLTGFRAFIRRRKLEESPHAAALFLAARLRTRTTSRSPHRRPLKVSSALQYGSILCIHLEARGQNCAHLRTYLKGLRRSAEQTTTQALPVSKNLLRRLINEKDIPERVRIAMFLLWITSSRASDLWTTRASSILRTEHTWLIVFCKTKTNRDQYIRVDHMCPIVLPRLPQFVQEYLKNAPLSDPILPLPPAQLRRYLTTIRVTSDYVTYWTDRSPRLVKSTITLHSFKRGAIGELWSLARQGKVEPNLIPLMAKHKSAWNSILPDSTIAYAPNPLDVVFALGMVRAVSEMW